LGASIKAISYYLPDKILGNEELSSIFPEFSPEEIFRRSGVNERYISAPAELPSDLAVKAAEKFFTEHNIDRKEIDFIIFCALILDRQAPATACLLQNRLNLSQNIGAIDIPLGCSGYVYSLSLAKSLIYGGIAKKILILAGDCITKTIHPQDHAPRLLFGDAMTATLVEYDKNENIGSFVFGSDGSGAESLIIKDCNARENSNLNGTDKKDLQEMPYGRLYMNGMEVLSFSLKVVPKMIEEVLKKDNLTMNDIDMFIFHQSGQFVLEKLRWKMKVIQLRLLFP